MDRFSTARAPTPWGALVLLALQIGAWGAWMAACRVEPAPVHPGPTPDTEPTPAAVQAACDGLLRAGCREGRPSPGGATCFQVMSLSAERRAWPLQCWAGAQTRLDVLVCGQTRCPAP